MIELTNCNYPAANVLPFLNIGETAVEVKAQRSVAYSSRPIFSVETCARIELSLVPEVEAVFIERDAEGEFRIISVVNERDAAVRERVYAREEAIMEAYPGLKFDFHVIARMNRSLSDVISKAGKLAFWR